MKDTTPQIVLPTAMKSQQKTFIRSKYFGRKKRKVNSRNQWKKVNLPD